MARRARKVGGNLKTANSLLVTLEENDILSWDAVLILGTSIAVSKLLGSNVKNALTEFEGLIFSTIQHYESSAKEEIKKISLELGDNDNEDIVGEDEYESHLKRNLSALDGLVNNLYEFRIQVKSLRTLIFSELLSPNRSSIQGERAVKNIMDHLVIISDMIDTISGIKYSIKESQMDISIFDATYNTCISKLLQSIDTAAEKRDSGELSTANFDAIDDVISELIMQSDFVVNGVDHGDHNLCHAERNTPSLKAIINIPSELYNS